MNRKERRALGFTESRYRKYDAIPSKGWYDNAFVSWHSFDAHKLGSDITPRRDRQDGKPRRWQVEKARRLVLKLGTMTELDLGYSVSE